MGAPWMTVLTCPARREYFAATMAALARSGAADFPGARIVFVDGSNQLSAEDWEWYIAAAGPGWDFRSTDPGGDSIGTKPAMLYVLHAAARAGAAFLLYFEDDIALCANAVRAMERIAVPDHLAFLAFCDIKNVCPTPDVIVECPGYDADAPRGSGGHWGNQALKIPGRALEYLGAAVSLPDWEACTKASDIMLGLSLATGPAPWREFGVFGPWVQHVGERSLVNPQAGLGRFGRDSLVFRGEGFDALMDLGTIPLQKVVPFWRADPKTRLQNRFLRDELRVAAMKGA